MAGLELSDWTSDYYINNKKACQSHLESINISQIPSLNSCPLHNLKDGQLVRFSGMIQDMYNPEIYFENYEVKNTITGESSIRNGTYKETALCQNHETILLESDKNKNSERTTFVVISVPGLNEWAKEKCLEPAVIDRVPNGTFSNKRAHEDNEEEDEPMDTSEPARKKEKEENEEKKEEKGIVVSKDHLLNFPIPNEGGRACIVKVYDASIPLKLNQVVDVIGFVSLDPTLHSVQQSDDFDVAAEIETHNPPTSLIPRLHAITIVHHQLQTTSIPHSPDLVTRAQAIRTNLRLVLSQLLFGDELAADYVICHLLSTVYMRKNDLCLGNYPLNITNFSIEKFPDFPTILYKCLTQIVTKSHYFECTLENLNTLALIPKKDYECNRLTSGVLQLSDNTHFFIDETKLTTGQLSAEGRKNYQAISDMMTFQKVTYDFKFYSMQYETDIPILVLSETKSLVPCVVEVPLAADPHTTNIYTQVKEAAGQFLKDESRVNDIRQYLEQLRSTDFGIDETITHTIQEDFVQLRQEHKTVNADNLHSLMVLARLNAISYGEKSLTTDRWKQTFSMEIERLKRLANRKK